MLRINRILVPTDFSGTADAALEYAFVLAERFGATVNLLHVLDDPLVDGMSGDAYIPDAPTLRTAMLDEARERLAHRQANPQTAGCLADTEVLFGHGARTIVEYAADRGIDLIVMGTHGRTGFAHLLLGSVAERVVQTAPCPVLTLRHPEARKQRAELVYDVDHLPA